MYFRWGMPLNAKLGDIQYNNTNYWYCLVSTDTLSVAYWLLCYKERCLLIGRGRNRWCPLPVKLGLILTCCQLVNNLPTKTPLTASMWAHGKSSLTPSEKSNIIRDRHKQTHEMTECCKIKALAVLTLTSYYISAREHFLVSLAMNFNFGF